MRRPLIVGNWKMNGSRSRNAELLGALLSRWQGVHQAEVGVCSPSVYLQQLADCLTGSNIWVGAQDVSPHDSGAYTGEVSAAMLAEMDCHYVIVGHSERREYHGETDALVAQKFAAAQKADIVPILCVGETLAQRDAGDALVVIGEQLKVVIEACGRDAFSQAVIAYEPVWAIGTGRTATPKQAQEVHAFIRDQLGEQGLGVRILYGGSVKGANAADLFAETDIDGALVGGASLKAEEFIEICRAAE
ncbi:triose-phosphate isomerase [Exilibacterium tricleocarpae]|uniref:Triosephosphate isomerase n=1 Tax=Exilibacterium tricleocarpae TaxID=2591008 RepID=A0A545TBB5_9GAMM|nr:triose-phosphate isomerase [Exilibacterium tricleocarpae]TQV74510.1 triose-phosphate isomerase [Exilibacterium tricleocarpae]